MCFLPKPHHNIQVFQTPPVIFIHSNWSYPLPLPVLMCHIQDTPHYPTLYDIINGRPLILLSQTGGIEKCTKGGEHKGGQIC